MLRSIWCAVCCQKLRMAIDVRPGASYPKSNWTLYALCWKLRASTAEVLKVDHFTYNDGFLCAHCLTDDDSGEPGLAQTETIKRFRFNHTLNEYTLLCHSFCWEMVELRFTRTPLCKKRLAAQFVRLMLGLASINSTFGNPVWWGDYRDHWTNFGKGYWVWEPQRYKTLDEMLDQPECAWPQLRMNWDRWDRPTVQREVQSPDEYDVFGFLPTELVFEVVFYLSVPDLLRLRDASRAVRLVTEPNDLNNEYFHARFWEDYGYLYPQKVTGNENWKAAFFSLYKCKGRTNTPSREIQLESLWNDLTPLLPFFSKPLDNGPPRGVFIKESDFPLEPVHPEQAIEVEDTVQESRPIDCAAFSIDKHQFHTQYLLVEGSGLPHSWRRCNVEYNTVRRFPWFSSGRLRGRNGPRLRGFSVYHYLIGGIPLITGIRAHLEQDTEDGWVYTDLGHTSSPYAKFTPISPDEDVCGMEIIRSHCHVITNIKLVLCNTQDSLQMRQTTWMVPMDEYERRLHAMLIEWWARKFFTREWRNWHIVSFTRRSPKNPWTILARSNETWLVGLSLLDKDCVERRLEF